jgi:formylmethanofuran dehydrogenase subunit E
MGKSKVSPKAPPIWVCECSNQELFDVNDVQIAVGKAIFRKPGCKNCKRPIQLIRKADVSGEPECAGV